MNFKLIKSSIIFKGKVFDLKVDEIEYNSGNKSVREVAVHPGGALIAAVTNDNKFILVSQFRYPLQKELLELPAGKLDKNESPQDCALRELEEETGYSANSIKKIGEIYTTPGYSTEKLHLFLAKDLKEGNHNREEGEYGMKVFEFTANKVEMKIENGEITDSKTITGFHLALKYLK